MGIISSGVIALEKVEEELYIYIKSRFHVTLLTLLSIVKQFELLALKLDFTHGQSLTVIGCY